MTCQLKIGECGRVWPHVERMLIDADDVLVVGWRPGSQIEIYERLSDVGVPWVTMIDVHEPNVAAFRNGVIPKLQDRPGETEYETHACDVRFALTPEEQIGDGEGKSIEMIRLAKRDFCVYIWQHGPEHLEKNEAIEVLSRMRERARVGVIVEVPLGDQPNPPELVNANPAEEHRSTWSIADLEALGFTVEKSTEGEHAIAVWLRESISDYAALVG